MNKKGLSLIEILVSMIIMGLVVSGLVGIFISGKRYILHSRSRITGGELGRYFLDPLQMQVRQDTWSTSCLSTGGDPVICLPDQTMGIADGLDRDYAATYRVDPDQPILNLSRVVVTINWTEPAP